MGEQALYWRPPERVCKDRIRVPTITVQQQHYIDVSHTSALAGLCAPTLPEPAGVPSVAMLVRRRTTKKQFLLKRSVRPQGPPGKTTTIVMGSICSGLGTCHMAMQVLAAWNPCLRVRHAFACDSSAASRAVLEASATKVERLFSDVTAPEFSEAPNVDVFVAGFPCQPFSRAGRRPPKGMADPRSQVLPHMLDYIGRRQPRLVLLENVCGLLQLFPEVVEHIIHTLQGIGYGVTAKVLNSRTHGYVPQNRPRLYIAGILGGNGCQPGDGCQPDDTQLASIWPGPLPTPSLDTVLADAPQSPDARPRGNVARRRVDKLIAGLRSGGQDPQALRDVVVNCNGISLGVTRGYTPCLTTTRGGEGGVLAAGTKPDDDN